MTAQQFPLPLGPEGLLTTSDSLNAFAQALGLNCLAPGWDGWVDDVISPIAVSNSTDLVFDGASWGDQTSRYPVGTKLSCTDNSVTKYGYVTHTQANGTPTFTTLFCIWALADGSATTLSGVPTNLRISYMDTASGFPSAFVFTPGSITGWSGTPTTVFNLSVIGRNAKVRYYINGTSNANSASCVLPFAAAANAGDNWRGAVSLAIDNAAVFGTAEAQAVQNSTALRWLRNNLASGWTTSGQKAVMGVIDIPI